MGDSHDALSVIHHIPLFTHYVIIYSAFNHELLLIAGSFRSMPLSCLPHTHPQPAKGDSFPSLDPLKGSFHLPTISIGYHLQLPLHQYQ